MGKEGSSARPDYNRMIMYSFANTFISELAMQILGDRFEQWLNKQPPFDPKTLALLEKQAGWLPELGS